MLQSPPRICGHPDHSVRRAARIELRSMGCTIWALRAEHKALWGARAVDTGVFPIHKTKRRCKAALAARASPAPPDPVE